jgi:hypothetical protein
MKGKERELAAQLVSSCRGIALTDHDLGPVLSSPRDVYRISIRTVVDWNSKCAAGLTLHLAHFSCRRARQFHHFQQHRFAGIDELLQRDTMHAP